MAIAVRPQHQHRGRSRPRRSRPTAAPRDALPAQRLHQVCLPAPQEAVARRSCNRAYDPWRWPVRVVVLRCKLVGHEVHESRVPLRCLFSYSPFLTNTVHANVTRVCGVGQPRRYVHTGHIKCRCTHQKNDTVAELRRSHRIHLNIRCFWSCCGARWDDSICEVCGKQRRHTAQSSSLSLCACFWGAEQQEQKRADKASERAGHIGIAGKYSQNINYGE